MDEEEPDTLQTFVLAARRVLTPLGQRTALAALIAQRLLEPKKFRTVRAEGRVDRGSVPEEQGREEAHDSHGVDRDHDARVRREASPAVRFAGDGVVGREHRPPVVERVVAGEGLEDGGGRRREHEEAELKDEVDKRRGAGRPPAAPRDQRRRAERQRDKYGPQRHEQQSMIERETPRQAFQLH